MFHSLLLQLTFSGIVGIALGVLGVVALIGASVIVLLSRKREDVHLTERTNVEALTKLLATRKIEIEDLEQTNKKLSEDATATALEFKQLVAIDIRELLRTDSLKREVDALSAENLELRRERDALKGRLKSGG